MIDPDFLDFILIQKGRLIAEHAEYERDYKRELDEFNEMIDSGFDDLSIAAAQAYSDLITAANVIQSLEVSKINGQGSPLVDRRLNEAHQTYIVERQRYLHAAKTEGKK